MYLYSIHRQYRRMKLGNILKSTGFHGFARRMNSIRMKLILVFLVPVILIVVLGVISYLKSSKGLVDGYENSTLSTMAYMEKYITFGMETVSDKAGSISNNEILRKYYSGLYRYDKEEEETRFKEVLASVPKEISSLEYISNIYIFSDYGNGFSGSGTAASKLAYGSFAANGEGALLEAGGKIWIGKHPYIDEQSGISNSTYALSYMSYIYDYVNKPIGSIVVDVSYDYIMETISDSGFPDGSIVAFITGDGREIVSGIVPDNLLLQEQSYFKKLQAGSEGMEGSEYVTMNKEEYLFLYSKLDHSNITLCTLIPKSAIVAEANEVRNITILVIALAGIIAISSGSYMAYGFSHTIHKVNIVLHKAETGDLTSYTDIRRRDEFRILGKSINDVMDSMQKLIRKMISTGNTVSDSASAVSESSAMLANATKSISEAVADIENGVTQQAADAESCLHQMSALADKINKLYTSTHNIEQIAGDTGHIVNHGMAIVDDLGIKARDTNDITSTVIHRIENLESESKAVSGIVETINAIAEQTNLLSLNASIEAARAGEYGRGFSVVADEIRKLADQTIKASNEIAKIIKRIENHTGETVKTAKDAENIVLSQMEALTNTVQAFSDISSHVEKLMENLNLIVTGADGIEHAKDDTLRVIESISATTQETAAATEELSVITQNQLEEANKLNDVVMQLNQDAGSLMEAVKTFKIIDQ